MTLARELNRLFNRPKVKKPIVGIVAVDGVIVTKRGKLWTCEFDGRTHTNSRLGDIKAIIRRQI